MNSIKIDTIIRLLKKEQGKWKDPFVSAEGKIKRNAFTTLISCILSLRTKDQVTAKASIRLLKKYNTPEKIIKLSEKKIRELIYPVGFYKTKAKRIKEICNVLIKNNSKVPNKFEDLLKLKGVGPKTAAIVMVYGHKKPEFIPVDTHLHRISNRLGLVKTKTPEKTMEALMKTIPKKYWYDLNELFVSFGQNVCLPVSPLCSRCVLNSLCPRINVNKSR